jgi:hypothetical protein
VLIKVQRYRFSVHFSLLELKGYGVVLKNLKLISWDFKKLLLGFMHQGKHVWLQGLKTGRSNLQGSREFVKKPPMQGLLLQVMQQPANESSDSR